MLKSLALSALALSFALPSFADSARIERRARNAGEVVKKMVAATSGMDSTIPSALFKQAKCIAVFPRMFKAALGPFTLGLGGQKGKGLVSCRDEMGQFGAPSFVNLSAASMGLQFGIQRVDFVLVYVGEEAIDEFVGRNFSANAEASATVGPIGRSASLGTDIKFDNGIYSYSYSRGLFAGLALGGMTVSPDKKANKSVYGADLSAADILGQDSSETPPMAQAFIDALQSRADTLSVESDEEEEELEEEEI